MMEYYYDLVIRTPEPEEILAQLCASRAVKAWKVDRPSRQLSLDEIDSLTDANIVDWHDFHTEYLDSLSNRRARNEKSMIDKSHDHIDDFEKLSTNLSEQFPDSFVDALGDEKKNRMKKNEWRSCVIALCHEYQRLLNLGLNNDGFADLPTRVRDILSRPWDPVDVSHSETMFYVGGAVSTMINKMGNRSKDAYSAVLLDIQSNTVTTKEDAKTQSLPMGKVEAKEMVNLRYINEPFFKFVNKIESVFHTLLSEGNIALYGSAIVADITQALSKEDLGVDEFLTEPHDSDAVSEVVRRIIWSYGRLRGKDFVRKCNAKVGVKHHETLRSTLGTASAIASAKAKKGGGSDDAETEEEKDPRWKFLIKQKKKELEYKCKNRKLPFSGTKKVITRRLIEFDAKQKQLATETMLVQQASITTVTEVCEDDEDCEYLQGVIEEMESEVDAYAEYFQEL